MSEIGLRERKKQRTRQAIAETAFRLFDERGFEHVTVAEVARAADVSEGTVFNYFPTKEDLFYAQMEDFEATLLEQVRDRPAGEPVSAAFARALLERSGRLAQEERAELIAKAGRTIDASPSLQAREREVVEHTTRALAALLADETLYVLADTAIVGHLGRPQIAALGLAGTVLAGAFTIFNFLTYGTTAVVARASGAGQEERAARLAAQALWVAVGIGATLVVGCEIVAG